MKSNSWRGTGSDSDVLLTPCVPEGITGYDDDDIKCTLQIAVLFCFFIWFVIPVVAL